MRLTRKVTFLTFGALGTLSVTSATIKPGDADSNVAAWLQVMGLDNPPKSLVTTAADGWVFWLGVVCLVISAIAFFEWYSGKSKVRPSTVRELRPSGVPQGQAGQGPLTKTERKIGGGDWLRSLVGPSFETMQERGERKREIFRQRAVLKALLPEQPIWVPLHQALHYLVYDTAWAEGLVSPENERAFDLIVGGEFMEWAARGAIKARGKLGWESPTQVPRTTQPIPADYWVKAFVQVHGEIVLADNNRGAVGRPNEDCYLCVVVDQNDIERVWPKRAEQESLTPLARFCEPTRQKLELEKARNEKT